VVERQALREGARDLVERSEPLRGLALLFARSLDLLGLTLHLLVKPCVLDGDGKLGGERSEERILVLGQRAAFLGVGGEQSDQLLPRAERNADRSFDPELFDGS